MHTRRTIVSIVLVAVVAAGVAVAVLVAWLGSVAGGLWAVVGATVVIQLYRAVVRPWHVRWGATADEVAATMPGDELLGPGAATTTRATSIAAPPEAVWPWLVQLGYGRAGWYSYDWIDNDGRPSASAIDPALQHLAVGDLIAMVPGTGFTVRALDPGRSIVSQAPDGTTWCLALGPDPAGGARLVSRFRARFHLTPATALWVLLADPGAFVMERRMLLGIRQRAERCSTTPLEEVS